MSRVHCTSQLIALEMIFKYKISLNNDTRFFIITFIYIILDYSTSICLKTVWKNVKNHTAIY